jgi:ubiquinone/menaquinone biosynthesis C-methylase UbiE
MERIPEPELMDAPEQAKAYAEADFSEANGLFVELFAELLGDGPAGGRVVDLGCGPADIPLRLAHRFPALGFDLVDGAQAMLDHARRAWAQAGLLDRARLVHARVPDAPLSAATYDAVISNSLLHHLHEPSGLWTLVRRCARPGARVLVMDLRRPVDSKTQDALVAAYAADAPPVLRRDFRSSLGAAFTPEEVRAQLEAQGLGGLEVRVVSDRHLAVSGRLW